MNKAYELLQESWQIMIKNIAMAGTTEIMAFKSSFLLNHSHHSLRQSVALLYSLSPFLESVIQTLASCGFGTIRCSHKIPRTHLLIVCLGLFLSSHISTWCSYNFFSSNFQKQFSLRQSPHTQLQAGRRK